MSVNSSAEMLERLPEWARTAQEAVATDEVQAMIQRLADFNLAVCMPHMHPDDGETGREMAPLPLGTVQVERNLVNTFVPSAEAEADDLLPVAWRWADGLVVCANTCPHE